MTISLLVNLAIAGVSYLMAIRIIPRFGDMFIKANLFGIDLCKDDKKKVPESFGVLIGCVFLVAMFIFIPIPFTFEEAAATDAVTGGKPITFPHEEFVELIVALLSICCMILLGFADDVLDLKWRHKLLLPTIATLPLLMFVELIVALLSICCMILLGFADDVLDLKWRHKLLLPTIATLPLLMFVELIVALLSICCMILLGFADDVLDLKWRHKLLLPTIATLPLLMVYYVNYNSTTVILPKFAKMFLGNSLDIGFLYYIYMGMLAVFCTNAINILAGINGLEVGQSLVIGGSILSFNCIELLLGNQVHAHKFSLYLMLPFLAVTLALWKFNKYPSQVFVGDTFCYFAGMTFAVVGILGHFSKTLILFFLPQIVNFLYSIPQLFHFVPCPRHRLPKYDPKTDLLNISTTEFYKQDLNFIGSLMTKILRTFKLITWQEKPDGKVVTNNFTLINLVLVVFGPVHEQVVTQMLMGVQVTGTLIAFLIRYPLASFFYDT